MAKPIISWLDDQLAPLAKIQFSSSAGAYEAVVADTESIHKTIYIANNFTKDVPAAELVYDATRCQLKVISSDGTYNSPVVKEKWLGAKCVSGDDVDFTLMGGTNQGDEVKLTVTAGDVLRPATISGGANDGTILGTGKFNVASIEAYIKPALNTVAEGGKQAFRLSLIYSYGEE